jgi:signal transduction histidine kinase
VHHAVEAVSPLTARMGQQLAVVLPSAPILLNADANRLTQVLSNLLNNACKYTDKGGRIELSAELDSSYAVIRVRDNGIGIAPRQLPLIFDMFMQVDSSLERSQSGLGIGLTLVKNLVELHGGTVEAHSAGAGQGSEFVVRLPILVANPEAPAPKLAVKQTAPHPGGR